MRVGYFGIPGAFTHSAACAVFPDALYIGASSFRDVFTLLDNGDVEVIVVPIENTLAGSIYENYDLLAERRRYIQAETYLKIEHALLGVTADLDNITDIYSHQKALEQCTGFFAAYPKIQRHVYGDTASSAKFVADQSDPTKAAIASREAAAMYGLTVLQDHLEDDSSNITRFLAIGTQPKHAGNADKTSIMMRLSHTKGSLNQVLEYLHKADCNLTKIESRPIANKPFEYQFYLDFLHASDTNIESLLKDLSKKTLDLTPLGTYLSTRSPA